MKTLDFSYNMELKFSMPVCNHRFTIKCKPQTSSRQRVEELNVQIYPNLCLGEDVDSFGNLCIFGHMEKEHDRFSIQVSGRVLTGLSDAEEAGESVYAGMYRYQTAITQPGEGIRAFADSVSFDAGTSDYEKAGIYMKRLYERFIYEPGVTDVETTAEEAFALGRGVCQDYAHIMLSLCRIKHIPARYVVGLLEGEGQSHAWIEVWSDGKFYPLDPTNNCIVDDSHIKISSGRDYRDCLINQGMFTGAAKQTRTIQALVSEVGRRDLERCGQ